jgi:CheY-like chemotaxis protein
MLVVEDQDAVREVLVRSLVEKGYWVVQAGDGIESLALLTNDPTVHPCPGDEAKPSADEAMEPSMSSRAS